MVSLTGSCHGATHISGTKLACPSGESLVGEVKDLHDGCYNGCAVSNLSPTISDTWVQTLQGEYSGEECTEPSTGGDVNVEKMLACGTAGSSDYQTRTENPIDFAIGNKYFHTTDYRGSGSFPIVFDRTYNSLDLGWRYAYTQRIETLDSETVAVRRPNGKTYQFRLSNGQWQPDPDVTARLEAQTAADGSLSGWRYILPNNTRESYDAGGRLVSVRNSAGLEQVLTYHAAGFTISGPQGEWLQVDLDANGWLAGAITDVRGRATAYQYNGRNLTQVTYPDGTTKHYLYEVPERPWLITGIIDANGRRSNTVAYDDRGRAIMSELADGAGRVDISYNADGSTTVVNALGKRTTFRFATIHGVRKIVHVEGAPTQTCQGTAMDYRFDSNGFLLEKTDAEGIITRYVRDTHGLELSRTEAAGRPEARTVVTAWDTALRRPLRITRGNTETENHYDSEGRLLARTLTDLTTGAGRSTAYTYNDQGLLERVDGPRTDVTDITAYTYDAAGRLSRVINALGHTTEILERDPYGRPVLTRDANGLETRLAYDDNGRLTERDTGGRITTMTYDAVGNLTRIRAPGGVEMHYQYDTADRLTGISDAAGNRIAYTLDAMGNRMQEDVFDAGGNLARTQRNVYDALSRLLQSIGADGRRTTYGYDRNGNRTLSIDPVQQMHQSAYDGLNRLISQTDALQGVTAYGYDTAGNLATVTDPNGHTTTYVYDGLGNLVEQHSPDTGTTVHTYDAAGNLLSKTDAGGAVTRYQYDALNRLVHVTYHDGSDALYEYDSAANGIGRLARLRDSSGETAWTYDLHGRIITRTQHIIPTGATLITAWQYNSAGQLSGITYPSGLQAGYAYSRGNLSAVTVNGRPVLEHITYQPFGPLNGWQWSNGSLHQRGYDLDGRLISQSLGNTIRTLSYDPLDNIIAITDPAGAQQYAYDALNRLTAADAGDYTLDWSYDANGNRLSESNGDTVTAYTIAPDSNRLLAVAEQLRSYDAAGNLVQDGAHTYQYDAQQRLSAVDDGAIGVYRYNAFGQRVYKKAGEAAPCDVDGDGSVDHADLRQVTGKDKISIEADGPGKGQAKGRGQSVACIATQMGGKDRDSGGSREWLFVYDEHRLLGEYDAAGHPVQETVWLGNIPVATVRSGSVYDIHADHLGTPRVITDSTNTEVWRWDSDPFGTAAADEDPDGDGVYFGYNLRFPGQYFDGETGLHYNYFRDYDPNIGRYIESDPIGLAGGLNLYLYANGNPVTIWDATGQHPAIWGGARVAAAALAVALKACAKNVVCRCRALYVAYKSACAVRGCKSDESCAVLKFKTSAAEFCYRTRHWYIAAGCDRVIPTTANHPAARDEAAQKYSNCVARRNAACSC